MVITFQIVLLVILIISFLGTVGEKEDITLRNHMFCICIASIAALVISLLWL